MHGTRSAPLNVAEGGEGEDEGTRLPCVCHGSVLVFKIKISMCSLWFTWTTSCVQEKQET